MSTAAKAVRSRVQFALTTASGRRSERPREIARIAETRAKPITEALEIRPGLLPTRLASSLLAATLRQRQRFIYLEITGGGTAGNLATADEAARGPRASASSAAGQKAREPLCCDLPLVSPGGAGEG